MLSIQYCPCNTINTILLVKVILLVNTILIINCKQLESFKVRAKFSPHPLHIRFTSASHPLFNPLFNPLHILFPIRSKSALNPFSNPLQILFPMQKY